jgi:hypothetical protein
MIGIDEHDVTLLAEHATILLPGRRPRPINFHVCVLHLRIIHTISSLQNLLGIRSSSATLLCNKKGVLKVCIMVITRAGANRAAAKAVSTSREKGKRRKSAARTHEWRTNANQRSDEVKYGSRT